MNKGTKVALGIFAILVIDQLIKIYIKTNFAMQEDRAIVGNWFHLHFVENEGMAWGMKFGGSIGKIILTLFRLVAVIWGTFFIKNLIKKENTPNIILWIAALIYAGAAGNLIDSMFYGIIFNESSLQMQNIAHFVTPGTGYSTFLHGKVVDMFYFPLVDTVLPSWIPFWGNERFTFFDPVFNFADASISGGVILLAIYQLFIYKDPKKEAE